MHFLGFRMAVHMVVASGIRGAGFIAALGVASSALAQTQQPCPSDYPAAATCYSGKDGNGAFFFIAKPSDWNGMLVVYAHSGPNPFGAEQLASAVDPATVFSFVVREGYAWVSTSYRRGGFGVRMAAKDADNARRIFVQAFGQPKRTILFGASYGALVAAKMAEIYPANYDGAMFAGGIHAGATHVYLERVDLRAVYQFYCGNLPRRGEPQYPLWSGLPAESIMSREQLENRVNECTGIKFPAEQRSERQQQNLSNILNVARIPERALLFFMGRNTFGLRDIVRRFLGGRNAFSNIGVRYTGSSDDEALNRGVARFESDEGAVADLAFDADPTGNVRIPVLTLHAIDDPASNVENEALYREILEQAGAADHLVQTFTNEHEHLNLSMSHYAVVLAALRDWIISGRKPSPQTISDSCGKFAAIEGQPCLFAPDYQPKPFWSRVYPRTQ